MQATVRRFALAALGCTSTAALRLSVRAFDLALAVEHGGPA